MLPVRHLPVADELERKAWRSDPVAPRRGSRLYLVAVVWAAFVLVSGISVDAGGGVAAGIMALVSIVCLAVSVRGWKHLLALPLYLLFALELVVLGLSLARR